MSRRGAWALGASLLLHAAVLGALRLAQGGRAPAARPAPAATPGRGELVAVAVVELASPGGAAPGAPSPPQERRVMRPPAVRAPQATPAPVEREASRAGTLPPGQAPEPSASAPAPASPVAPPGDAAPQEPTPPGGVAGGEAASAVAVPGPEAGGAPGDAGGPAGAGGKGAARAGGGASGPGGGEARVPAALLARLEEAARRCYPAAARRFRLRGEAAVRFCATPAGAAVEVALLRTSGAALLDAAAVGCVVPGAQPLPVDGGCYRVPVRFDAAR